MNKAKKLISAAAILVLSGCATTLPPSDELKVKLAKPVPRALVAEMQTLIDDNPEHFAECVSDGEKYGRPLTAEERSTAKEVGVTNLDRVRVVTGKRFWEKRPMWILSGKYAHTCGYTMFFSPIGLVANFRHELTHVMQMERNSRLLGIDPSPEQWMVEYLVMAEITGYMMNPYEREAEGVPFNTDNRALKSEG